jgi:methylmalonyl-CoA/ethylmalonyl-CoA epimerase
MENYIDKKGFIQICIVVEDIEKAAGEWASVLNIPVPQINCSHIEGGSDYNYRGEETSCDLKVASFSMGNFVIELHQPIGGKSTFSEFLEKHGNGVHHIGFEVGDKRDLIISELEDLGYAMRTVGYYPGSSWTIVDSEDKLGVNLNIKPIA